MLREAQMDEQWLVGVAFLAPDKLAEMDAVVKPHHFRGAKTSAIWKAALSCYKRIGTVNIVGVGEELSKAGLLGSDSISAADIVDASQYAATSVGWENHTNNLLALNRWSELANIGSRIIDASAERIGEPETAADKFIGELQASVEGAGIADEATPIAAACEEAIRNVQRRKEKARSDDCVTSGLFELDDLTGGVWRSEVMVVAGRPGMGKSALAMTMAQAAAEAGWKTLVCSMEMSKAALAERMLSRSSRVRSEAMRNGRYDNAEFDKLLDSMCRIGKLPLWITDIANVSPSRLSSLCRRMKLRGNLDYLIVDYMQLMQPDDKGLQRQEQVASISRAMKQLAMELKIAVVALSQLNRSSEARGDKRPVMSDLRESGAIEQDADTVALVYRPEYYGMLDDGKGNSLRGVAEIDVAKQRNGPAGTVKVAFVAEYTSFENLAKPTSNFGDVVDF